MRAIARADIFLHSACAALLTLSIAALASESLHPAWRYAAVPALFVYASLALRRPIGRMRADRVPFPHPWRETLLRNVNFYRRLDEGGRSRFERNVRYFIREWRIEGVGGVEITDEVRVLIAAAAAVLLHGQPEWELPRRHTILVYPGGFDEKFNFSGKGPFVGQAHGQGPVIMSREALFEGWRHPEDGENVALHEFAHLLDMKGARSDGVPRMLNPAAVRSWLGMIRGEMMKVEKNRSLLRSYAATNEAEFFAVAVEYFFERPRALRDRHPGLYGALAQFFNQDPAELQ